MKALPRPLGDSSSGALAALRVASSKRLLICLGAVLCALLAYWYSRMQPPTFQAEGALFLTTPQVSSGASNTDPIREARTQAQLLAAPTVIQRTAAALRLSYTYVEKHVVAEASSTSNVITLKATAGSADTAVRLVTQTATSYRAVSAEGRQAANQQTIDDVNAQLSSVQKQIADVDAQLAGRSPDPYLSALRTAALAQVQTLTDRRSELALNAAAANSSAFLFQPPQKPLSPAAPRPTRNAVVALLLGAFVSVGGAWLWVSRRGHLDHERRVSAELGIPLLATIPTSQKNAVPVSAYRAAATAIEVAARDDTPVMTVSGGVAGDVNPDSLLALASMLDETTRVLIIDAEGSDRGLSQLLGVQAQPGFSDVVAEDIDPLHTVVSVSAGETRARPLSFMPAGASARQRGSLGADRLARLLRRLLEDFDRVIIVGPPALASAESALLISRSQGVITFFSNATPLRAPARLAALIEDLEVPLLGYIYEVRSKHKPSTAGYRVKLNGKLSELLAAPAAPRTRL
jgi:Mrp family chromosome partitioning ATPase